MTLVARASKTVRLKNLIIVLMCLAFCGMFFYDGYYTYPARNDRKVASLVDNAAVSLPTKVLAQDWLKDGGWNKLPAERHEAMNQALDEETRNNRINKDGWKGPFDVRLQRLLAWCLLGCLTASIWWFGHCQRRRAIAEEATVSPAPGVVIPWEKITRVDNTRWKSVGIVDITYTDDQGATKHADFDDYKLEREPLLTILDQLGERAVNAEFVPKEEGAKEEPAKDAGEVPPPDEAKG